MLFPLALRTTTRPRWVLRGCAPRPTCLNGAVDACAVLPLNLVVALVLVVRVAQPATAIAIDSQRFSQRRGRRGQEAGRMSGEDVPEPSLGNATGTADENGAQDAPVTFERTAAGDKKRGRQETRVEGSFEGEGEESEPEPEPEPGHGTGLKERQGGAWRRKARDLRRYFREKYFSDKTISGSCTLLQRSCTRECTRTPSDRCWRERLC